jgi:acetyltransferase-like isoleucine patch superfamily enzyme
MSSDPARVVSSVHGLREASPDPAFFEPMADWLRATFSRDELLARYGQHVHGSDPYTMAMRAVIWRAVARRVGTNLQVGDGVGFKHLETFEIGSSVFIGAQAYIQGRYDGTTVIGDHVWIGPQAYFDARSLVLEDYVGWGPGAKVLGSAHTALPVDIPIIQTDLEIKPVRVCEWADIGTNAVILPGVTIGKGAMVGAGAVVTHDVPPFAVVAGVPARIVRYRNPNNTPAERDAILAWRR